MTLAERLNEMGVYPLFESGKIVLENYEGEGTAQIDNYWGEKGVILTEGDERAFFSIERGDPEWGDLTEE